MPGPGESLYGSVFVRGFDLGLTELFGSLGEFERDGESFPAYVLDLPALDGYGPDQYNGKVPIIFWPPEGVFEPYVLPSVIIRRGDPMPAWMRFEPGGTAYKLPAENASPVVVSRPDGSVVEGYDQYETREKAYPFDLPYDIEFRGRKQWQKVAMWEFALRRTIHRILPVKDTAGNERSYMFELESVSHADDLADVTDRTLVTTLTISVYGEFDLTDPVIYAAVKQGGIDLSQYGSRTYLDAIGDC